MRKIKFIVTLELQNMQDPTDKIMDDLLDRITDSYTEQNIADSVQEVRIEDYRKHKSNLTSGLYTESTYINGVLKPLYKFRKIIKRVIRRF